jgi:hypothetical protein
MNRFRVLFFTAPFAQCLRRSAKLIPLAIIALPLQACGGGGSSSSPAIWKNFLYMGSSQVVAYTVSNASIGRTSLSSNDNFVGGGRGTTPSISALNASNGILWALDTGANGSSAATPSTLGPAILRAYDASTLGAALFDSSVGGSNTCGNAVKFTIPMVANGKVYVGGDHQVTVYGLKP